MSNEIGVALVDILPQLIVIVVVAILGIRFRQPLAEFASTRVGAISAFGFKVELVAADVDHAVQARATKVSFAGEGLTHASSGQQLADRATRLTPRLAGRTVLWVDDHPEGNHLERRLVNKLGVFVDVALGNDEANALLDDPRYAFDLVISDIKRDDHRSGLELLRPTGSRPRPQVIFYITDIDPSLGTPAGAHGITDRPDELLDLVMDVLDRLPPRKK